MLTAVGGDNTDAEIGREVHAKAVPTTAALTPTARMARAVYVLPAVAVLATVGRRQQITYNGGRKCNYIE